MISLIVCHRNKTQLERFEKSVAETIGVPHEIIVIDNSKGQYGICEAYNLGASSSKYALLCFVHEDVVFYTQDWGQNLAYYFKDATLGAVGIAGARYFGKKWGSYSSRNGRGAMRLIQHFRKSDPRLVDATHGNGKFTDAKCLDGVFIVSPKRVWEEIKFDQETFKHFHCYDIDYTLSVSKRYKVYVAYNILLEHFSYGNYDERYFQERELFQQKWEAQLPIYVADFNGLDNNKLEWRLFFGYCDLKRKALGFFSVVGEIAAFYKNNPNWFYLVFTLLPWPIILWGKVLQMYRRHYKVDDLKR
jgi:hypothetical protein